jgi:alanine racemase
VRRIRALPGLNIEGAYTHFANIEDTLDPSFALRQLERFREAMSVLEASGVRPPLVHASATAGTLLYPETGFTMVRLGIGAYGIWPLAGNTACRPGARAKDCAEACNDLENSCGTDQNGRSWRARELWPDVPS